MARFRYALWSLFLIGRLVQQIAPGRAARSKGTRHGFDGAKSPAESRAKSPHSKAPPVATKSPPSQVETLRFLKLAKHRYAEPCERSAEPRFDQLPSKRTNKPRQGSALRLKQRDWALNMARCMGTQNRRNSKSHLGKVVSNDSRQSAIERARVSRYVAGMGKSKIPATGEGYLGEIMVHRLSHAMGVVESVTEAKAGWAPQITLKLADGSFKKGRLSDFREPSHTERKTISGA